MEVEPEISATRDLADLVIGMSKCCSTTVPHHAIHPVHRVRRNGVDVACGSGCRSSLAACVPGQSHLWKANQPLGRFVDQLPVRCAGCPAVVEFGRMETHAREEAHQVCRDPGSLLLQAVDLDWTKLGNLVESATSCGICAGAVVQATHTSCGHGVFCQPCLASWFGSGRSAKTCPCCRKILDPEAEVLSNPVLQLLTDQTPFACPRKCAGCTSHPTRSNWKDHVCMLADSRPSERETVDNLEKRLVLLLDDNFGGQEQRLCLLLDDVVATCGELHPLTIMCLVKLGEVEKKLGMYASCGARYRKATHSLAQLALLNSSPVELDANLPIALAFGIAEVERKLNRWNEAEVGYHRALELLSDWATRSFDPKHRNAWFLVQCHRGTGLIFKKRGLYARAEEQYDLARAILEDGANPKHGMHLPANANTDAHWKQATAIVLTDQCDLHRKRANYSDALSAVNLAIAQLAKAKPILGSTKTSSDEGDARYAKALVLVEQALRPEDALSEIELAGLCYVAAGFAPNHLKFGLLEALTGRAKFLVASRNPAGLSKDFEDAQAHLTKAINLLKQSLNNDDMEIADCRLKWIECFAHLLQIGRASSLDSVLALKHLNKAESVYSKANALADGLTNHHVKLETCALVRQLLDPDNMWLD